MDLYKNSNLSKVEHKEGIKVNIKDDPTTSNGRRPQNIKSWIPQQPLIGSSSNFKLKLRGPNQNKKMLQMKTTCNGRRLQDIEIEITQQPMIRSS